VQSVKGAARSETAYKQLFIETDIAIQTAAAKLAETRGDVHTQRRAFEQARESFFAESGERPDQLAQALRERGVADIEMQMAVHYLKVPETDYQDVTRLAETTFCNRAEREADRERLRSRQVAA